MSTETATSAPLAPAHVARFALAGDATFTLSGKESRFTFHVEKNAKKAGPAYFVKVLTGPNNTRDFTYLGCIFQDGERFTYAHGRKSKIGQDAPSARAFGWFSKTLFAGKLEESRALQVHHEGRCGRCGRALTVPESVETGLGPVCSSKES